MKFVFGYNIFIYNTFYIVYLMIHNCFRQTQINCHRRPRTRTTLFPFPASFTTIFSKMFLHLFFLSLSSSVFVLTSSSHSFRLHVPATILCIHLLLQKLSEQMKSSCNYSFQMRQEKYKKMKKNNLESHKTDEKRSINYISINILFTYPKVLIFCCLLHLK